MNCCLRFRCFSDYLQQCSPSKLASDGVRLVLTSIVDEILIQHALLARSELSSPIRPIELSLCAPYHPDLRRDADCRDEFAILHLTRPPSSSNSHSFRRENSYVLPVTFYKQETVFDMHDRVNVRNVACTISKVEDFLNLANMLSNSAHLIKQLCWFVRYFTDFLVYATSLDLSVVLPSELRCKVTLNSSNWYEVLSEYEVSAQTGECKANYRNVTHRCKEALCVFRNN